MNSKIFTVGAALLAAASFAPAQSGFPLPPIVYDSVQRTVTLDGFGVPTATVLRVERSGLVRLTSPGGTLEGTLSSGESQELSRAVIDLRVGPLPESVSSGPAPTGPPNPLAFFAAARFRFDIAAPGDLGGWTTGFRGGVDPQYQGRVRPIMDVLDRIERRLLIGNTPLEHTGTIRLLNGQTFLDEQGFFVRIGPAAKARELAALAGVFVRLSAVQENGVLQVRSVLSPTPALKVGTLVEQGGTLILLEDGLGPMPWQPFVFPAPTPVEVLGLSRLLGGFVGQQVVLEGYQLDDGRYIATSVGANALADGTEVFRYVRTSTGYQRTVIATLAARTSVQLIGISRSGLSYKVRLANGDEGYVRVSQVELEGWAIPFTPGQPTTPGLVGTVAGSAGQ